MVWRKTIQYLVLVTLHAAAKLSCRRLNCRWGCALMDGAQQLYVTLKCVYISKKRVKRKYEFIKLP